MGSKDQIKKQTGGKIEVVVCKMPGQGKRPYKHLPESCSVLVSVGTNNFEGNNLKAMVTILSDCFSEVKFIVADTLQRYNLALERGEIYDAPKVVQEARERGKKFVKEVKSYEEILTKQFGKECHFEFIRWDHYLNDKDFSKYLERVDSHLANNTKPLKDNKDSKGLNEASEIALQERLRKHGDEINKNGYDEKQFIEYSKLYKREECAAMYMWRGMITYPGGCPDLNVMSKLVNEELSLTEENVLNWQNLKLDRRAVATELITPDNKEEYLDTAILQVLEVSRRPSLPIPVPAPGTVFLDVFTKQDSESSSKSCERKLAELKPQGGFDNEKHKEYAMMLLYALQNGTLTSTDLVYKALETIMKLASEAEARVSHSSPPSSPPHKKLSTGLTVDPVEPTL